jgi:hypothetical protein
MTVKFVSIHYHIDFKYSPDIKVLILFVVVRTPESGVSRSRNLAILMQPYQ